MDGLIAKLASPICPMINADVYDECWEDWYVDGIKYCDEEDMFERMFDEKMSWKRKVTRPDNCDAAATELESDTCWLFWRDDCYNI